MRYTNPFARGPVIYEAFEGRDPEDGRCLTQRRCATCKAQTTHAYLRDWRTDRSDARDWLERKQHQRAQDWGLVLKMRDQLVDCEVRVQWLSKDDTWARRGVLAMLLQYLDDGSWTLHLDRDAEPRDLLAAMERALTSLALDSIPSGSWIVRSAKPGNDERRPWRAAWLRGDEEHAAWMPL